MSINVKRCYFHSIQPLINYNSRKSNLEEVIARLDFMLEYGYLVPGCELYDILPKEYKGVPLPSIYEEDSIFLAQHILTELKPIGGSYLNGDFSAYLEHIVGSPALVFDESVIKNKRIEDRNHPLSEEICIQDKIPLKELIAISLPYKTPLDEINRIYKWFEEGKNFYSESTAAGIRKEYQQKLENILKNGNLMIEEKYSIISMFQDCLRKHQMTVPCIRCDGTILNQEEEYQFIEENKEKIQKLIKRM